MRILRDPHNTFFFIGSAAIFYLKFLSSEAEKFKYTTEKQVKSVLLVVRCFTYFCSNISISEYWIVNRRIRKDW
jgi:hypothetical protein